MSDSFTRDEMTRIIQKNVRGYLSRKELVIRLLREGDWGKLPIIYRIFGESLNKNDMKHMKGKLYELFVSSANRYFKHVDQIGYDITCFGIRIEHKFTQDLLLTEKSRQVRKNISFRCKNSNGSNEMELSRLNTASIYILTQRDAIGFVYGYDVLNHLQGSGDLDAKIPSEFVHLLWKKEEQVDTNQGHQIDISDIITKIFTCISYSVWNAEDWKASLKACLYKIADDL